ncbi:peroxiredoxin family protein [Ferruginibacter sp.]|nr:redoxin domain-containing protein [Ferruginibacter sp.]
MKRICKTVLLILFFAINVPAQVPAKTVPSFTFKKLDKSTFSNNSLEPGKFLFFVFFDTECDHCHRSITYINQHYNEFKKTAIYLITLDSAEKIIPFINKYGIGLKDKKNVTILQDTKNEFIHKFGPRKYPSLFLYSKTRELMIYADEELHLPLFVQKIKNAI